MLLIKSHKQLKDVLRTIPSLSLNQREKLYTLFDSYFDYGGVSEEEYVKILHYLYGHKSEYEITETDYQAIKQLKEELKKSATA
jgi:ABC-type phosphate/phosphonate transport system substrate-binding protein